jgi:tetratricopeptide (TPR) repeat protein
MNREMASITTLFAVILSILCLSSYADSPRDVLNNYVLELQRNPGDYALREKIIKYVQTMKYAPVVSEDAKRHMSRGIAAIEEAKTEGDFKDAIAEFEEVINAAPWLGQGYKNLGIAQDMAGQYDKAISNLNLYLLTNPADADKARDLIYKIEFRKEKAQKEKAARDAVAERQKEEQLKEQRWLDSVNGARFILKKGPWPGSSMWFIYTIDIHGKEVVTGSIAYYGSDVQYDTPSGAWSRTPGPSTTLKGHEFVEHFGDHGVVSDDGNSINVVTKRGESVVYRRQR